MAWLWKHYFWKMALPTAYARHFEYTDSQGRVMNEAVLPGEDITITTKDGTTLEGVLRDWTKPFRNEEGEKQYMVIIRDNQGKLYRKGAKRKGMLKQTWVLDEAIERIEYKS